MMLGLVACGTSTQTPIDNSASSQSTEGSSANISGENTEEPEVTVATIESTVLVDQDGIVITAQELVEDSIWGTGIKLLIENNSSENQIIQCDYAVVNNFMMTSLLFSADVAAGKKANETLYFSDTVMEGANISTITDMSFVFYSMSPNTYQRGFTTEEVSISTSASGSYEQPIPDEGKELYNQNGIRIVGSYVEEDTFWGAGVVFAGQVWLLHNSDKGNVFSFSSSFRPPCAYSISDPSRICQCANNRNLLCFYQISSKPAKLYQRFRPRK